MGKIYVIYGAALCCLFGALVAVFWTLGLGRTPPKKPEIAAPSPPPLTAEERIDKLLRQEPSWSIVYAKLYENIAYVVPHDITLYQEPQDDNLQQETLPSGGIFLVAQYQSKNGQGWYQVVVNNGVRNYTMYIRQDDIDPYNPAVYGAPPTEAQYLERQGIRKFVTQMAYPGVLAEIEREQLTDLENQPDDLERISASIQDLSQRINSRGILLPIVLAAVLALVLTLVIAIAIWIKQSYLFGSEYSIDELYHPDDDDVYERTHEAQATLDADASDYGLAPTDDPMNRPDYDLPKSPYE
jgi:hypothetical protein